MLPAGAIDCHFHVFEAGAPLNVPRSYTPSIVTIADYLTLADALNIAKGVLVQPSVYGLDNSVLLRALARAPERLRGIVVVDPAISEAELEHLHRLGVRGVRVNMRNKGGLPFSAIGELLAKLASFGWSVQLQLHPSQLADLRGVLTNSSIPVVIDHLGFIPVANGAARPFVADLRALLDQKQCFVKLSAPYRLSQAADYVDFGVVAMGLAASHPERLLWATDWPHTELWDRVPDDADLIDRMHDWLGDERTRRLVFAANAQALFFGRDGRH